MGETILRLVIVLPGCPPLLQGVLGRLPFCTTHAFSCLSGWHSIDSPSPQPPRASTSSSVILPQWKCSKQAHFPSTPAFSRVKWRASQGTGRPQAKDLTSCSPPSAVGEKHKVEPMAVEFLECLHILWRHSIAPCKVGRVEPIHCNPVPVCFPPLLRNPQKWSHTQCFSFVKRSTGCCSRFSFVKRTFWFSFVKRTSLQAFCWSSSFFFFWF